MSRAEALLRQHVEANQRVAANLIVTDVDHPDALLRLAYLDHPRPNLVTENPDNGHAHGVWVLAEPVTTTDAGRWKPLVYLSDVTEGLRRSVDGDPSYAGFLTKNPVHEHWETRLLRAEPYSLGELQNCLREHGWMPKFGWHRQVPVEALVGFGRNCSLFDSLRRWAYRAIRQFMDSKSAWLAAVHEHAIMANERFTDPLPRSEVHGIARSVGRWVWSKFGLAGAEAYDATFGEMQAARGRRSAAKRTASAVVRWDEVLELVESGMSYREIGERLGISEDAVKMRVCRAQRSLPRFPRPEPLTS